MKAKSNFDQSRLPLLKELDAKLADTFGNFEELRRSVLELTLFYHDQLSERKSFTCRVKPRHFVGAEGQEMLISFEYKGVQKAFSLPLSTMVGDLFAFLTHSVTICHLAPDSKWINSDQIFVQKAHFEHSTDIDNEMIEVLDSQCTIGELLFKSKGKNIVAIRNQKFNLCALISNSDFVNEAKPEREVLILLDSITEELQDLIKSKTSLEELGQVLSSCNSCPKSSIERWTNIISAFENFQDWKYRLSLSVDHTLFLEMLYDMKRIVNELYNKKRVVLSPNDKIILFETAIFFDKMKEMRA
ncbi:MAG: hypothetical protein RI922_499 [Bacteroidota bacterium]|jgi:hypothetical protein